MRRVTRTSYDDAPADKGVSEQAAAPAGLLADRVYRELLQAIKVGEYADRPRLPSETEMATRFGVSRPVLRQALQRLKQEGIIHAERGSGNFVAEEQQTTLSFPPLESIPDVQRCLEFRLALESQAATIAAERRSEQNLARLQSAWERFRDAVVSGEGVVEADFDFHMAVADATNSQYYVLTLKALRPHIIFGINLVRTLSGKASGSKNQVLEEHEQVVRAIRASDPVAARDAMAIHLQAGIKRLFP